MAWWTSPNIHPKTKSRFIVSIGGGILWSVKSCTKPSLSAETKEYRMINHYYKYPGLVKWNPITITFVDAMGAALEKDEQANFLGGGAVVLEALLAGSGYKSPVKGHSGLTTMEKNSLHSAFGGENGLIIQQISVDGKAGSGVDPAVKVVEQWNIVNPLIKSIDWGSLDYGDDGLVEYKIEIDYDYAIHKGPGLGDEALTGEEYGGDNAEVNRIQKIHSNVVFEGVQRPGWRAPEEEEP